MASGLGPAAVVPPPPPPLQTVISDQVPGHPASWEEKTLLRSFRGGIWASGSKFWKADFASI